MIDKNKRGNIVSLTLDKVDTTLTQKNQILALIVRQDEISETINFILKQLKKGVSRTDKF